QRPVGVAQARHVGDAGDLLAPVLQADERSPDRDAADEVARAVDGVDDPAEAGGAGRVPELFAEEAVLRKRRVQRRPQRLFRLAVGDGDGALVRLPFDLKVSVEVADRDLSGPASGFDGHFVAVTPFGVQGTSPLRIRCAEGAPFTPT